jgi:hypothetical protein
MNRLSLLLGVVAAGAWAAPAAAVGPPDRVALPKVAKAGKWTEETVAKIRPGMTRQQVGAILGPRSAVNPKPPPFGVGADEVLVLWKEGGERWIAVVFVAGRDNVLRVPTTGETYLGYRGF